MFCTCYTQVSNTHREAPAQKTKPTTDLKGSVHGPTFFRDGRLTGAGTESLARAGRCSKSTQREGGVHRSSICFQCGLTVLIHAHSLNTSQQTHLRKAHLKQQQTRAGDGAVSARLLASICSPFRGKHRVKVLIRIKLIFGHFLGGNKAFGRATAVEHSKGALFTVVVQGVCKVPQLQNQVSPAFQWLS